MQYAIKIIVTAIIVTLVSETGKRFSPIAAILASLPLTSILAIIWLYYDTKDVAKISGLSTSIFWAVLPSLIFFIVLPLLLKTGMNFYWSLIISCVAMFVAYTLYALVLGRFGIKV